MTLRAHSQNKFTTVSVIVVSAWCKSNSFWFYQQNPSKPRTCNPIPLIPISYLLQTPSCKSQEDLVKAAVSLKAQRWTQKAHQTFWEWMRQSRAFSFSASNGSSPTFTITEEDAYKDPKTKHCYLFCLRECRLHVSLHVTLALMIGLLLTTPKTKSCLVLLLRYGPLLLWRACCWKAARSGSVFDSWVGRLVSILNMPVISCLNCPKNKAEAPNCLLYQLTSVLFSMRKLDAYWTRLNWTRSSDHINSLPCLQCSKIKQQYWTGNCRPWKLSP